MANKQDRESYIQVTWCPLSLWPYCAEPVVSCPFYLLLEDKKPNPFVFLEWFQNRARIASWRWPVLGVFTLARFWFPLLKCHSEPFTSFVPIFTIPFDRDV